MGTAFSEDKPIRLHVIAEDDSVTSQDMKMKIRDTMLEETAEITKSAKNAQNAYSALFASVSRLRTCARETAVKNGFTGDIDVIVTKEYFPARLYGDVLLKEGEYPCVRVTIGKAEGKNWWCVLFPDLCLYGERTDDNDIRFYSKFGYVFKRWILGI